MGIAGKIADKIANSHHMAIRNRLCSRFRTPKSGCTLCADACPVGAISISEEGAAIEGGCTDCGVCISACPNGAIDIKVRDDKEISGEIRSKVNALGMKTFRISCRHGDETADLVVPCLSRLTENLLLEPVKAGVTSVEILRPLCEKCPGKKASPHLKRVVKQSRNLYEMLGVGAENLPVVAVEFRENRKSEPQAPNSGQRYISRREIFSSFRNKAIEVAADAVPNTDNNDNGDKESFNEVIYKKAGNVKRAMLLETIREIGSGFPGQDAGLRPMQGLKKVEVPTLDCIITELEVGSNCTACGVCVALCPTGAITQKWTEGHYSLSYRPALCTNCGVCVAVCMPGAIRMKETASLDLLLSGGEIKLFEEEKRKCRACGMDFVAGESDICPLCVNIHNKQMEAVKNLFRKEV